jgi:hypothetical protein
MGNSLSDTEYTTGDIPRETYNILKSPGWAYYKCSIIGKCSFCSGGTDMWTVSVKEKGHFVCLKCRDNEVERRELKLKNIEKINIEKINI